MPRARWDITNEQVKELYKKHGTKTAVAQILDCSERLVFEAIMGTRKNPPKHMGPKAKAEDLCTCCGIEPKAPGNRFLCKGCFIGDTGFDEVPCHCPIY